MSPKKSPPARKQPVADNNGYEFDDADRLPDVEVLAGKLKSPGKGKETLFKLLKQLAAALEAAPQDVEAMGGAKGSLPQLLLQYATAESANKKIRLYCALCIMHVMRLYAPDIPYDDEGLKEVFELLLTCWTQLADTGEPEAFELCHATLKIFADVKFFILMLDLEDAELVPRTFRTLLQAARPENLQALEGPLLAVLSGILEELGQPPQELCDLVLAALACPAVAGGPAAGGTRGKATPPAAEAQYTVAVQRLATQLLTSRDSALRGALQRQVLFIVRKSLQDDANAAAGGAAAGGGARGGKKVAAAASRVVAEGAPCDTFTLLNGLRTSAPLLLLPVVPELKAQLRHEEDSHRAAAAELVMRLMAAPPPAAAVAALQQQTSSMGLASGAPGTGAAVASLATQYPDLFQELLSRFADQSSSLRQQMLLRTGQMAAVAAAAQPDGALERQVLTAARDRLHDFDDKAPPGWGSGGQLAAAAATPPVLYDNDLDTVLQNVGMRLRDLKIGVRKDAAAGLLVAWRSACEALHQGALSLPGLVRSVGWIPARLCMEAVRELELRPHIMAQLAAPPSPHQLLHHTHGSVGAAGSGTTGRTAPGMVSATLGKQLGAAVWAALWASYGDAERSAVRKLMMLKAQVATELQQLVDLRRRLRTVAAAVAGCGAVDGSPPSSPEAAQRNLQRIERRVAAVCRSLARAAGGPAAAWTRGSEQLWALLDSAKDNFFWDRLGELAAPGSNPEALATARKDALSRLPNGGSKSPVADLITRIGHTAQPTLLSPSHVAGLMGAVGMAGDANDSAISAAASFAVAAAKSAPGLCCTAMPLVVSIVTTEPPRPELACTTAVRVLRHTARHCGIAATESPNAQTGIGASPGGAKPGGAGHGGRDQLENGDDAEREAEDEELEDKAKEGEQEGATPVRGKKRARTEGPSGAAAVSDGAARRVTRGQQQQQQQQQQQEQEQQRGVEKLAPASPDCHKQRTAALTLALTALSQGPYPKAAKAAVHALWAVLGPEGGKSAVTQLASQLMAQLRPGMEVLASTPAVLQAMASVGEVAPGVFAEHVDGFCKFVSKHYMLATLKPPVAAGARKGIGGNTKAPPFPSKGDAAWEEPPYGIGLKVRALRALARGCTPDAAAPAATAVAVPAATTAAVSAHVEGLLVQLVSIVDDVSEYGATSALDRAHLCVAAARALLHLAKRHDSRLLASSYVSLALTMQDPVMEVRQAFGEQVRLFLQSALQHRLRPHVIAKYAALLPLACVDPRPEHRDTAGRMLREVVLVQRARAQEAAMEAANTTNTAAPAAGGSSAASSRPSLADLPEFMLAFLVYILAHHPDCPEVPESPSQEGVSSRQQPSGNVAAAPPQLEEFQPFQDMLQFALEPLMVAPATHQAAGGGGSSAVGATATATVGGVGEALPAVCKVLRSVKLQMQDADETFEPPATRTMRTLADMGIAVAKAIVQRELAAAAATLKDGRHHRGGGLRTDGSCLPPSYQVVLNPAVAEMGRRNPAAAAAAAAGAAGQPTGVSLGSGRVPAGETERAEGAMQDGTEGAAAAQAAEDEAEEGGDGDGAKRSPAKRGPLGGHRSAKRKTEGAAAGRDGEEHGAVAKKGRREPAPLSPPAAKKAGGSGAGRGRGGACGGDGGSNKGKGRTSGATKAGGGSGAAKRRRAGGYESLSEGEPSSSSEEEDEEEEEEEDEQEEELVEDVRVSIKAVAPKHGAAAAADKGKGTGGRASAVMAEKGKQKLAAAGSAAAVAAAAAKAPGITAKPQQRRGAAGQRQAASGQEEEVEEEVDEYELPEEDSDNGSGAGGEVAEPKVKPRAKAGRGRAAQPAAAGSGVKPRQPQRQQQQQQQRKGPGSRLKSQPAQQRQHRKEVSDDEDNDKAADDVHEAEGAEDDDDDDDDKENTAVGSGDAWRGSAGGDTAASSGLGAGKSLPARKGAQGPVKDREARDRRIQLATTAAAATAAAAAAAVAGPSNGTRKPPPRRDGTAAQQHLRQRQQRQPTRPAPEPQQYVFDDDEDGDHADDEA
ncbi:hypothetical protein VOLCADRAFT_121419 [Volvox carteri f. nagariensis]|uniref:Sister chromatid cohesion protein n=1 Tax=Volvox carteri f. nagariensis TaxID=3068 RepID=D8U9P9_VOLCA|nr:uncharacterized protein VOLCADRAFT_121419 [Volvox carteri f. nagariensis]EFJ43510.1 hypothetical protein VOLCADRAFT_121419 [Volvox carteri f. nagariensis]|eukprot:XP_002955439.1 hypothetical protein VOLCADRAFT_121419 [Volvox carteri f. nagariensis]